MGPKVSKTEADKRTMIRMVAFWVVLPGLVIIPFGVMHGLLGQGWTLVADVIFCLGLAVIAAGAIAWAVLRLRVALRK